MNRLNHHERCSTSQTIQTTNNGKLVQVGLEEGERGELRGGGGLVDGAWRTGSFEVRLREGLLGRVLFVGTDPVDESSDESTENILLLLRRANRLLSSLGVLSAEEGGGRNG